MRECFFGTKRDTKNVRGINICACALVSLSAVGPRPDQSTRSIKFQDCCGMIKLGYCKSIWSENISVVFIALAKCCIVMDAEKYMAEFVDFYDLSTWLYAENFMCVFLVNHDF